MAKNGVRDCPPMAHAGQEINGKDGFRLRLIRTGAETGGELLEMEAHYSGTGSLPPEHLHPRQVERIEVLEGAVRATIDGEEHRYAQGDTFEVAAGTPHTMAADGPARTRWEVRPALRTAEFFERLHGGGITDGAAFLAEFADEFRLAGT
jgi:quercetin dioxygenase-like cupin family protein